MFEQVTSRLGIGAFKQRLPRAGEALPGRGTPLPLHNVHFVNGHPLRDAGSESGTGFPGMEILDVGMGCFWGAERKFWQLPGVYTTAVGYQGGITPNPTYEESCTGLTGHAEVVRVVFDPAQVSREQILRTFWENHDPTQGMGQGNDRGTEYRSAIHCQTEEQYDAAIASRDAYQQRLREAGYGEITTEIVYPAPPFYYAEDYHQQYLAKNPNGYCGLGGTGVSCAIGLEA
jgi:peptide-methionine (S)-S-oxide reductase